MAAGLFAGPGETRALGRAFDWEGSPVGAVEDWPLALRAAARLVLDSPIAMSLFVGPQFVTLYNDAYRTILGAKHPAAFGRPAAGVWAELWQEIGPQYVAVSEGGPGLDLRAVPFRIARLEGGDVDEGWFDYALNAVRAEGAAGAAGAVVAVLAVVTETTARAQAEQALEVERARLEYAFKHAPAFFAVLRGPAHVFTLVNDAYYQLVGHRDLLGKRLAEALPEVPAQGFDRLLDEVVATGEPFIGREVPVMLARTPGAALEERFVDLAYIPIVEVDGTRGGVIVHGTDVTAHVLARREVERLLAESERLLAATTAAQAEAEAAQRGAEAANRAKSEFLAVMSHELRTPLNAIGGYAELIQMGIRGPVTPQQLADLERIQTSQRHLLGLINEVLNYVKLGTGSVQFEVEDVPLAEVVVAAQALVAPQARKKGLALVVADSALDLAVRADTDKLRQVLVNLLGNAVKFTAAGGRIEVTCEQAGPRVLIRVRDTGMGIAPGQLTSIFDPFVQVRSDLARTQEGTGLGLAISRDLARGMGGELTAESVLGEGSTFTLSLPGV
jgi:signal transduction histidine kinase